MAPQKHIYHLVYPHQLFEELFLFPKETVFVLIEDPLFFGDKKYPRNFHKQKIVLHRASMRAIMEKLTHKGFKVHYFEYTNHPDPEHVATFFNTKKDQVFTVYDPVDYILERRLKKSFSSFPSFSIKETPNFLTPLPTINSFFKGKKKLLMNSFYIYQRKRLGILVDNDKPIGGKWSFDTENRKRLPKDISLPYDINHTKDTHVAEAIDYTNKHFKHNPGNAEDFNYPIDHASAQKLLTHFITHKLSLFGAYEDAITEKDSTLFHSTLSAPLNIGLLSPATITEKVLSVQHHTPIASLEGFIRQIIGWREFMRAVYVLKGSEMRNKNFLKHTRKLPQSWYNATTGIHPIDHTIQKVLTHAYCHHIERLMILGNFMLLLQIKPSDIYDWFMDLFIDAYDWVMVPNVYAMSQFADGGTVTTKPYFSSSHYVLKMSDYKKGEWCEIWDSLFYVFLENHRAVIAKNPRLTMLIKNLEKLSPERKANMKKIIKKYT
jgi:deoxyribodipyrimidine photolyase-related protein